MTGAFNIEKEREREREREHCQMEATEKLSNLLYKNIGE